MQDIHTMGLDLRGDRYNRIFTNNVSITNALTSANKCIRFSSIGRLAIVNIRLQSYCYTTDHLSVSFIYHDHEWHMLLNLTIDSN